MTDKWLYRAATCKQVSPACGRNANFSSQQLQNNNNNNDDNSHHLKAGRQPYAVGRVNLSYKPVP